MRLSTRFICISLLALMPSEAFADAGKQPLWEMLHSLQAKKWIDLTHEFDGTIPHWKGVEPMKTTVLYDHDKDGFRIEQFCHVGQWGTHIDPPVHFHKGMRSLDAISVQEMFLPLVVVDVHEQAEKNPDYQLSVADIKAWEKKHGDVPKGAFVAMRTDWSKRWPDQAKMQNVDAQGVAHYPGWSKEALVYLYETRKITASGHETTDTDPGIATTKDDYSLESYILQQNHYQIELLANLDQVPESGALISATWPKAKDGSGFPARAFAIVP